MVSECMVYLSIIVTMSGENDQSVFELLSEHQSDAPNQSKSDTSFGQTAMEKKNSAIQLLGSPGKYSLIIYITGFCLNAFVAFNHVSLPSLYAVPISHRCISRNTEVHNISLMKSNTSSDLDTRVHDSCFEMTSENRTNMKRALCKTWKFTYSYGYAKTWVNEWDLVCKRTYISSLGQSLYMAGVMIGSPLTGMVSDRFGRRPILLFCLLMSSILSLIMLFLRDVIAAIAFRFIIGFFISGVHTVIYLLPSEMSSKKILPVLSVAMMNSFIIGIFIGNTVIYFLKDWKAAQVALCCPGIVLFIVIYFVHTESPSWALVRQKEDKYNNFFNIAMNFNKLNKDVCEKINKILEQSSNHFGQSMSKRKTYTSADLFKTSRIRQRSFIGMYIWFTCGISFYALSYNIPNLRANPFTALLVGSAADLPCFLLAFFYIPRMGKRRSLIMSQFIGGLACLIYRFVPHLAILLFGKMFLAVSFGIAFIYLPEIFPTIIRNIGVGTLGFFSRAGGLLAPQLVLIGIHTNEFVPVIAVGCLSTVGGLVTIIAPETKGKELPNFIEDIELDNENIT